MRPNWAPRLDAVANFVQKAMSTNDLTRFEHLGIYAAKVRNVSRLGSQISIPEARAI
jgi:hypothetical protein